MENICNLNEKTLPVSLLSMSGNMSSSLTIDFRSPPRNLRGEMPGQCEDDGSAMP